MSNQTLTPEQAKHRLNAISSQLLLRKLRSLHYDHAPDNWKRKFVPSPHRDFFVQYVEGRKQMDLGLRDEITASLRQYESALAQATKIPMRIVVAVAARFYGVQLAEVLGHARTRNVVSARKAVCYLAASLSGYSFAEIGRKLANRDHSTISYLYHSLADKMVTDSTLRIQVETIKEQIVEYFTTIRDEAA